MIYYSLLVPVRDDALLVRRALIELMVWLASNLHPNNGSNNFGGHKMIAGIQSIGDRFCNHDKHLYIDNNNL